MSFHAYVIGVNCTYASCTKLQLFDLPNLRIKASLAFRVLRTQEYLKSQIDSHQNATCKQDQTISSVGLAGFGPCVAQPKFGHGCFILHMPTGK
jgi:hypothetical protein